MNKYLKNFTSSEVASKFDLTTYKNVSFDGSNVAFGKTSGINVEEGAPKTSYGDINKDLVVQLSNAETTAFSLKGKDVSIEGENFVGAWNKKVNGNAMVSINVAENGSVSVSDFSTSAESGAYNAIEIGLSSVPGSVDIDNVNFGGALSNNAILVFSTKDNAIINIKNVNFGTLSNPIRISNKTNATGVTVNIINCTCDAWDSNLEYTGMILFQDYTSKSQEEAVENNLFGPDKITINIENFEIGGNKIETPEDIATVCGTKDANQLFYAYNGYEGVLAYGSDRYPKINIA